MNSDAVVLDDDELVGRLADGDLSALGVLYTRYRTAVMTFLATYSPARFDRDLLEDVCQEVFLTLRELAPRYDRRGNVRPWLLGIASRKALGALRTVARRRALLAAEGPPAPRFDAVAAQLDAKLAVARALEVLPLAERHVIVLHAVVGVPSEEIAQALGISVNTVWTRLHRARRRLEAARRKEE